MTKNYMTMTSAYTTDTCDYIGDEDFAKMLDEAGIKPQLAKDGNNVCSIGFCEKDQKWYGWSHRARYGFGIGSEVKKGDCAYVAKDADDYLESMIGFWSDEHRLDVKGKHGQQGVIISWIVSDKVENELARGTTSTDFSPYPGEYGEGEWKAKTLEDAKQMAIDFADGVS